MNTFSVLVTDDQNCWFAVKPDICNLKPHVILHDCTCLKPSDYEDLFQKQFSRTPRHINLKVKSVYPSQHNNCKTYLACHPSPLWWCRKSCPHKGLHYLPHAMIFFTGRKGIFCVPIRWLKLLLLWNAATLWSASGFSLLQKGAGMVVLCPIYCYASPPSSHNWP